MSYDPTIGMILDDVAIRPEDIKPHGTRMLIQRREAASESKGKIIIPDTAKTPDYAAKVLAIGPDVTAFNVGDWVIIGRWNSCAMKLLSDPSATNQHDAYKVFHIVDEEDVWGTILAPLD